MLLCVVGPTACYKSNTAMLLAEEFGGEVISCDSVSVYKGLDIGSAKPSLSERQKVRHHLIDVADPFDTSFSVASFKTLADEAIRDCLSRGALPIICGGSGLYYDAVMHEMGYACPSSPEVREKLGEKYDEDPASFVSGLLAVDREAASRIPLRDKKRLVRAMEVYELTGKPFSSFNQAYVDAQSVFRYDSIRIGLTLPREALYERTDRRVDLMMERGLLEEVKTLHEKGLDTGYPSMQSIGYKQLLLYFQGVYSLEEAVSEIKKATRHLAKRQLTWFRRDSGTTWFDCSEPETVVSNIKAMVHERLYEGSK